MLLSGLSYFEEELSGGLLKLEEAEEDLFEALDAFEHRFVLALLCRDHLKDGERAQVEPTFAQLELFFECGEEGSFIELKDSPAGLVACVSFVDLLLELEAQGV